MPDCLADGAGKNTFLYRKTISLGLDFAQYIKEDSEKMNRNKAVEKYLHLRGMENISPIAQTL